MDEGDAQWLARLVLVLSLHSDVISVFVAHHLVPTNIFLATTLLDLFAHSGQPTNGNRMDIKN